MKKKIPEFQIKLKLNYQNHENDCVPSCVKSVLDTCYPKNKIEKEVIGKMMKSSKKSGTPLNELKNLNRLLNKNSIPYEFFQPDRYEIIGLKLIGLWKLAMSKLPPICAVDRDVLINKDKSGEDPLEPHSVIVVGKKDEDKVIYADPLILDASDDGIKTISAYRFNNAWSKNYKGAIFIRKNVQSKLIV